MKVTITSELRNRALCGMCGGDLKYRDRKATGKPSGYYVGSETETSIFLHECLSCGALAWLNKVYPHWELSTRSQLSTEPREESSG